jgi:pimeloyl-ACP methyl ester carboxylesterase
VTPRAILIAALSSEIFVKGYRHFGPDRGMPLVCLRDPWDVIDAWDPLILEGLSSIRPLVFIDRPVLVDSNCLLADGVRQKAEHTIEVIERSSDGRVDLLGYSMGGLVAQCVVSLRPELVRRVVFASPMTDLRNEPIPRKVGTVAARLLSLLFAANDTSQEAGRDFLERLRVGSHDWARLEKAIDLLSSSGPADQCGLPLDVSDALSGKGCDSLIIAATDDAVAPIGNAFAFAAELPGSRFSVYPDAGHGALFQYPDLFAHQIDHFLRAGGCT